MISESWAVTFLVTPHIHKIYFVCSHKLGGNHKVTHICGELKCYCNLSPSRPWWGPEAGCGHQPRGPDISSYTLAPIPRSCFFFCCFWTVGILLQYPEWQRKKLWKSAALFMSAGLTWSGSNLDPRLEDYWLLLNRKRQKLGVSLW